MENVVVWWGTWRGHVSLAEEDDGGEEETATTEHHRHTKTVFRHRHRRRARATPHRAWSSRNRPCMSPPSPSPRRAVSADPFLARIGQVSHGLPAFLSNPNYLLKVMLRVVSIAFLVSFSAVVAVFVFFPVVEFVLSVFGDNVGVQFRFRIGRALERFFVSVCFGRVLIAGVA